MIHTMNAPMGTDTYLLMPKSSSEAAQPANSASVLAKLTTSSAIIR
jgi:hypothetical protein